MTRVVVCDTGPLIHLSEAGAIHLLEHAGRITIPPIVAAEFEHHALGWNPPQWIEVRELNKSARNRAVHVMRLKIIDLGEAEAISLAVQLHAGWFLTDDGRARQFAESEGLEVHGSLGVILWNLATSRITATQAEALLDALARSSLWISDRVLAEARRAIANLTA